MHGPKFNVREVWFPKDPGPDERFGPIGFCIYCGATKADGIALDDEHFLPSALHGTLVLADASCRECAKIINVYEQRVLAQNLGLIRAKDKIRSRHRPKNKPPRFYADITEDMDWDEDLAMNRSPKVELRLEEIPATGYFEYIPGSPNIMTGQNKPWILAFQTLRETGGKDVAVSIRSKTGDVLRFVAKIAHGYATWDRGPEGFVPYLTDIIRTQSDDFVQYIGSVRLPLVDALHRIALTERPCTVRVGDLGVRFEKKLVVYVQLFASVNEIAHEVVVGHRHGAASLVR